VEFYGGIEAGGTKFVCTVGSGPQDIRAETRIPTTHPDETIQRTIEFFREQKKRYSISGIGIGSFGPVDINLTSPTYGYITSTPKPGWANTDIRGRIQAALDAPVAFDTDVNAAALGEYTWGAAQGIDNFVYITIGTGIGSGQMSNGKLMHGLIHPEGGHILIPHDWQLDPFPGSCPYHGDCFEGLASGPSIERRWGVRGETLPDNHPAWDLEARYIALAVCNLVLILSPERVILGGGVGHKTVLIVKAREYVRQFLNEYVSAPQVISGLDDYIVLPGLGTRSGMLGAMALARGIGEQHRSPYLDD